MKMKWMIISLGVLGLAAVQARSADPQRFFELWKLNQPQQVETLHVAPDGNDANDATASRPLATVQRAVEHAARHADRGIGTRIVLAPGTYRETIDITDRDQDDQPTLWIEAAKRGTVTISGSDVLRNWRRDGDIWVHQWPYRFGWVDNPWPGLMPMTLPGLRRELLFINKKPMTQVFNEDELRTGTYLVDEDAGEIRLFPPEDLPGDQFLIEASVRPAAAYGIHSKLLRAKDVTNLVLRGLRFEHAASLPFHDPALAMRNCRNVIIENCQFIHNGGVGISGDVANLIMRDVVASHNGTLGMSGSYSNAWIERCKTNDNNWRGALFGATGWAPCGFKFAGCDGMVLREHQAMRNHASGGWFDDSNRRILIEDFAGINNFRSGLSLEANPGPIVVRGAVLIGNSTGLNTFDNRSVVCEDSLIADNRKTQIRLAGSSPLTAEALEKITPDWRRRRLSSRQSPSDYVFRNVTLGVTDRAPDATMIVFWMRGNYRAPDGSYYLDQLNRTLWLDNVVFAHPMKDAALFPERIGHARAWPKWAQELPDAQVIWSMSTLQKRLEQAMQQHDVEVLGFEGGVVEDEDPGL